MKRVSGTSEASQWFNSWTRGLTPSLLLTGGTVLAAEVALQRGLACSTAGGTHHAFPSYGSGFCLLNDLAVAAKYLTSSPKRKVLIVDLDVHQVAMTCLLLVMWSGYTNISKSSLQHLYFPPKFDKLFVLTSDRVTALLSFLKRTRVCLHSLCTVGKTSPSVNNRVTSISACKMGWKTRSTSPQARQHRPW